MAENPKLRLTYDTYDNKKYTEYTAIQDAGAAITNVLSPVVVNLYGNESGQLPLLLMTEGRGPQGIYSVNPDTTTLEHGAEYQINVFGKLKTYDTVARCLYADNAVIGKSMTEFKVVFENNWLIGKYTVQEGASKIQAKVIGDPRQVAGGYEYTFRLLGTPEATVPIAAIQKGARWTEIAYVTSFTGSTGSQSRRRLPSRMKNQYSMVRRSYRLRGNVANKVVNFQIPMADGKTTNYYTQYELYMNNLSYLKEIDNLLLWSRYNRNADGSIYDTDEVSGEPVPRFAGLMEQIPNYDTYSILSESKISNIVSTVFYNTNEADIQNITIQTGLGGAQEFDRAMKKAQSTSGFTYMDTKTVQGEASGKSPSLTYGSYFGSYKHINGFQINIVINPAFDRGPIPDAAPRHPISGYSMESYKMLFLDNSVYNGERNIRYVNEKGRESTMNVVLGLAPIPGYENVVVRSQEKDESSVHFMKTCGIHIMRPTNCFMLDCSLS